jgi:hypothetical protein
MLVRLFIQLLRIRRMYTMYWMPCEGHPMDSMLVVTYSLILLLHTSNSTHQLVITHGNACDPCTTISFFSFPSFPFHLVLIVRELGSKYFKQKHVKHSSTFVFLNSLPLSLLTFFNFSSNSFSALLTKVLKMSQV